MTTYQIENQVRDKINQKGSNLLNVYFTAGYPKVDDTMKIIHHLEEASVDLIELGLPYSDPLADGLTIQQSSAQALKNGITLQIIFDQVKEIKRDVNIPIIAMGYYNQMLQYGVEKFVTVASESGISGLIIPDLPMDVYEDKYLDLFASSKMGISFLISPMTSDERIRQADRLSSAFIYVVSSSSITGKQGGITDSQTEYFHRIQSMKLSSPTLIGFGIHNSETYQSACKYSNGAIVGSAFIRAINKEGSLKNNIHHFIQSIR